MKLRSQTFLQASLVLGFPPCLHIVIFPQHMTLGKGQTFHFTVPKGLCPKRFQAIGHPKKHCSKEKIVILNQHLLNNMAVWNSYKYLTGTLVYLATLV